jgi:hypothetical protein
MEFWEYLKEKQETDFNTREIQAMTDPSILGLIIHFYTDTFHSPNLPQSFLFKQKRVRDRGMESGKYYF